MCVCVCVCMNLVVVCECVGVGVQVCVQVYTPRACVYLCVLCACKRGGVTCACAHACTQANMCACACSGAALHMHDGDLTPSKVLHLSRATEDLALSALPNPHGSHHLKMQTKHRANLLLLLHGRQAWLGSKLVCFICMLPQEGNPKQHIVQLKTGLR